MDSVERLRRGKYKEWKYNGGQIPRTTKYRRDVGRVTPSSSRPANHKKPVKRLQRKRTHRRHLPSALNRVALPNDSLLPSTSSNTDCNVQVVDLNQIDCASVCNEDDENVQDFNVRVVDLNQSGGDSDNIQDEENDEESFSLHLSTNEPEPANTCPSQDDSDSDDTEEVLDKAPGLHLSVNERIKLLLLLATKRRHKLTYAAAEDILDLAGVFSDEDIPFCASKHIMKRAIEKYSFDLTEHHICPSCDTYVGIVTGKDFTCSTCNVVTSVLDNLKDGSTFLHLPLRENLKELLESLEDGTLISDSNRSKIHKYNYEDIFDGKMYRLVVSKGTITINFFIDGLPVSTTSKQSAHPVLVTVNELPLVLRRKHIMMTSLWLSKKKPVCNEYLKPFVAELMELQRTGVSFRKPDGTIGTLKVKAACCISDSVARPTIRNSKQFNGKYGCGFCYHPGVKVPIGRGETRSYTTKELRYEERKHHDTLVLAARAEHRKKPQMGIKGKSILAELPDFDIVRCIDLDSFHAVVNVVKRFFSLWLLSPPKDSPKPAYNIHHKFAEVNRRLLQIKPTSDVSRAPRSLDEHSDFRGHEWFNFALFYSIPILKDILPVKYLDHWALFVRGFATIMQNSVSKSELLYADRDLQKFVSGIDDLYGVQNVTFCCHLLTHLARSVADFAQPFTHSALIYESFNNEIKDAVKSSNGISKQIVKAMQLKVAIVNMEKELRPYLSERQKAYLGKVNLRGKRLAPPHLVLESVSLLGPPQVKSLSLDIKVALRRVGVTCNTEVPFYDRFSISNEVFHTSSYYKVSKKDNSVVLLDSNQVFVIHFVLIIDQKCYILGHYYEDHKKKKICNEVLPHVRVLKDHPEGTLRCVRPQDILSKLITYTVDMSNDETLHVACINILLMEMLS